MWRCRPARDRPYSATTAAREKSMLNYACGEGKCTMSTVQYDLFSVDDHIIEPPNVWTDRLPAALQEQGPHVVEEDGRQFWLFEGRRGETMGLNAVAGKDYSEYTMDPVRYS